MYDIAINNGVIINPQTGTMQPGSVAVSQNRIAAISDTALQAKRILDAQGCVVCPGWIDPHGHLEGHMYSGQLSLLQGVTTTIGGNCGAGPQKIAAFFQKYGTYCIHQAEFTGHSILRECVGLTDRELAATPLQLKNMENLARQSLAEDACGISFGMGYVPGASYEEFASLSRLAKEHGRPVAVDTRMEYERDLQGLADAIQVARETGVRMIISHFVYQYAAYSDIMNEALDMFAQAEVEGLDIWMDSGMYTWWTSVLGSALFDEDFMLSGHVNMDKFIVITGEHCGQTFTLDLYKHMREHHGHDSVVVMAGGEEHITRVLQRKNCMPSSDAGRYLPKQGHPQTAGTFPRFIREMTINNTLLSLPEAVYRATLLPALVFGMSQKGRIEVGCDADLVVFDPQMIADCARYVGFGQPDAPPAGIKAVLVAGRVAVENGEILYDKAGMGIKF